MLGGQVLFYCFYFDKGPVYNTKTNQSYRLVFKSEDKFFDSRQVSQSIRITNVIPPTKEGFFDYDLSLFINKENSQKSKFLNADLIEPLVVDKNDNDMLIEFIEHKSFDDVNNNEMVKVSCYPFRGVKTSVFTPLEKGFNETIQYAAFALQKFNTKKTWSKNAFMALACQP